LGASIAALVPMEPAPPGWLTMTMRWPSAPSISEAASRVTWSVAPPAAQGTMMVTGLVGFQVAWAMARAGARQAAASSVVRVVFGMRVSGC